MTKRTDLSGMLRQAIGSDGRTARDISDAAGVAESVVSRFLSGSTLRLDNAERLLDELGFQIIPPASISKRRNPR